MAHKSNPNNSLQLKNQIHNLTLAREGVEKGTDVSGSMVKLNKTLTNIKPMLKKQQNYIKNFFTSSQSTSNENKDAENRRFLNRICEMALNDINDLLDVSEDYFSLDFKNSWTKVKLSFEKEFNNARQQLDNKNIIEFLFKVINLKDYFLANFMRSFVYRKCLLWKDLNITQSGFIHAEYHTVFKQIQDESLQKGYVPTKPAFNWAGFDIKGNWNNNKLDVAEYDPKTLLKLANQSYQAVLAVLKNYGNLNTEQRTNEDIDRNKEQVKSLRDEIEKANLDYLNLQKKYRQTMLKDQKSDVVHLKQKLAVLQQQLQARDTELKKIKFEFRDSSNQISSLKEKIKQLETDLSRINNVEMKKLRELQSVQNNLNDQFAKIYKNISNFGSMFEFQSDDKRSLAKQIIEQNTTIEKLADVLGREKTKNRDLQAEIIRLNEIILQLGRKLRSK